MLEHRSLLAMIEMSNVGHHHVMTRRHVGQHHVTRRERCETSPYDTAQAMWDNTMWLTQHQVTRRDVEQHHMTQRDVGPHHMTQRYVEQDHVK